MTTAYLAKAIAGEEPSADDWREHLARTHDMFPGLTPLMLAPFATGDGRSSYDVIADAVIASGAPRSVLDIGCGEGALLAVLRRRAPEAALYGIDLAESELALAHKRPELRSVSLLVGDVHDLPYGSSSIETVVAHLSLGTMVDVERAAREVHRVLAPGGRFTFLIENPTGLVGGNVVMSAAITALRARYPRFAMPAMGDPRMFAVDGLAAVLAAAGFEAPPALEDVSLTAELGFDDAWTFVRRTYLFSLFERDALDMLRGRVAEMVPAIMTTTAFPMRLVSVQR